MSRVRGAVEVSARALRSVDPRVSLFLVLLTGLQIWSIGPRGLAVLALGVAVVLAVLGARDPGKLRVAGTYLTLIAFWVAAQVLLQRLQGLPLDRSVVAGLMLGVRLGILLSLGLALALLGSPRALGQAIASTARPVLGRSAWKVALALALMVHFLPMAWEALQTTRSTVARRCPDLPWTQRAALVPQATLRALSQKTWDQTIALAARRLDSAEAWKSTATPTWADLAVVCVGPVLLWSLSLL